MDSKHKYGKFWLLEVLVLLAFLLVFGTLTITSFTRQTPTIDEPIHLLSGYSYLKWGDFRLNPEHPPLAKMWAALPLLWLNPQDPRPGNTYWDLILEIASDTPANSLSNEMFFIRNDADTLFFFAKLQMIILALGLAALVFIWSKELFGFKAGIVGLFLYCLDPTILAHSSIIHTDLPFAAFFFASTYFFCRCLTRLTWTSLLWSWLFFGFAAITKHSFIAIISVWAILGALKIFRGEPHPVSIASYRTVSDRKRESLLLAGIILGGLIASYVMIWAAYGFRFNAVRGAERALYMHQAMPLDRPVIQALLSFVVDYHVLPEAFISGYLFNWNIWQRRAYFLGQISDTGFWSYFPVALAVKTPVPSLIMLALAVGFWFRAKQHKHLWLTVPPAVYFLFAVISRFNIGIRHLLPIYPFLFVSMGGVAANIWNHGSRVKRAGLVFLGLWYLWCSVSIYPHYIAYFNELVGGPQNGHKLFLDSNLDWGQDLRGLKQWMQRNGLRQIQLLYFGAGNAKYYGIDDLYSHEGLLDRPDLRTNDVKLPEFLAVSANYLYRADLFMPKAFKELLESYKLRDPVANIGYSIYVYKLDLADTQVYINAAALMMNKERLNAAINLLGKAREINPGDAKVYYHLANALAETHKSDAAIEYYRQALKIDPTYGKAHLSLANALMVQGRREDAMEHYEDALKANRNFPEVYYNFGRILAAQGQTDQAIKNYRKAIEIEPDYDNGYLGLGDALMSQGRLNEAAEQYQKAIELAPDSAEAHLSLGRVRAAQGKVNEAIEYFRRALRLKLDLAEAHEALGRALAQLGRSAEAAVHYREALRILKERRPENGSWYPSKR